MPLAGMRYPLQDFEWTRAAELGFRTVVCLTGDDAGYDPSPLRCTAVKLQDLSGGKLPDDPDVELIKGSPGRRCCDRIIGAERGRARPLRGRYGTQRDGGGGGPCCPGR